MPPTVPEIDARGRDEIGTEAAHAFRESGFLVVRNLLHADELAALRAETLPLVEHAAAECLADEDYRYKKHDEPGEEVPYRVEYVADKTESCRALLGHPFVLHSVERL